MDVDKLCRLATVGQVPDMTPSEYQVWLNNTNVFDGYVSAFTMWRKACGMDVPAAEIEDAIEGIGNCDDSIGNPIVANALIGMGLVGEAKTYLNQYNTSPSVDCPHVVQMVIVSHQATPGKAPRTGGAATKRAHRSSGPM